MNDDIKQILDSIRKRFEDELRAKTGWGRNEVIQRYDKAVAQGALDYATSTTPPNNTAVPE